MKVPFKSRKPAHRQHHLPKRKQRLNLAKSIILDKSLNVLIFLFVFHISTGGSLILITKVCQPKMWFLCSPWERYSAALGSWTPSVVVILPTKTFCWFNPVSKSLFWWIPHNISTTDITFSYIEVTLSPSKERWAICHHIQRVEKLVRR